MTDTSQVPASKPFATSLTIQGTVVMLISAFAPILAGIFHVQVGDINSVASEAVTAISAVTALVGGVMAIIGRMRATTTLH